VSDTTNREATLARVAALYTDSLKAHGAASRAVGWEDDNRHTLRFGKLAEVIDRTSADPLVVNDLGCGYGAMFHYLDRLLPGHLSRYNGYDISADMVTAAETHVRDPRARFVLSASATEDADYGFVSGSFNVKMDATDEAWTAHVKESLLALAARSRRGIAFNLLTTHVDWRAEHLYYGDPTEYFEFCRCHISRRVALFHDYPLYEWTILVRKDAP